MCSLMAGKSDVIILTLSLSVLSIQHFAFLTTDLIQLTFTAAKKFQLVGNSALIHSECLLGYKNIVMHSLCYILQNVWQNFPFRWWGMVMYVLT